MININMIFSAIFESLFFILILFLFRILIIFRMYIFIENFMFNWTETDLYLTARNVLQLLS